MASGGALYVLVETAAGYGLLEVVELDEVASMSPAMQKSLNDWSVYTRICKLKAFGAFTSAEMALENITALSDHLLPERLVEFLEAHMPAVSKKKKKKGPAQFEIGVAEPDLAKAIADATGAAVRSDDAVRELLRGARMHMGKLVPALSHGVLEQSQLGLGHAFSRAKVKYNPARADNMIIQSIGLLDTLDKDINTFAMRCKEWYSWHFPELRELCKDNFAFARAAAVIGDRATFLADLESSDKLAKLADAVRPRIGVEAGVDDGSDVAEKIVQAARVSMGMDCAPTDMSNIMHFTTRMVALATYRYKLGTYLEDKMKNVAPNLSTLVGDTVGARLISKAGSLSSLAKCPASTVQILGAEKALFRALKNKGNTPKYGLIYHSTFIGRAQKKNKGRISRYLANKCAMASRIDAFADDLTDKYGEHMREQVEERLKFFDTGAQPRKNIDVMHIVKAQLAEEAPAKPEEEPPKKKKKKKKDDDEEPVEAAEPPKKKKKKKTEEEEEEPAPAAAAAEEEPKKKKKKKKEAEEPIAEAEPPKKKKKKKADEAPDDAEAPPKKKKKKAAEATAEEEAPPAKKKKKKKSETA